MTATPRIYGDLVKEQKNNGEVVLYSMDDEQIYGPTFHTITFSQAVALGSLVDYKVIASNSQTGTIFLSKWHTVGVNAPLARFS